MSKANKSQQETDSKKDKQDKSDKSDFEIRFAPQPHTDFFLNYISWALHTGRIDKNHELVSYLN